MKQQSRSFLARIRQKLFEMNLEAEVYGSIFPHLQSERDCGYSFHSDEEFDSELAALRGIVQHQIEMIEKEGAAMPKSYGKAFRYIAYRDINRRLAKYRQLGKRRIYPKTCDSVAVRLTPTTPRP